MSSMLNLQRRHFVEKVVSKTPQLIFFAINRKDATQVKLKPIPSLNAYHSRLFHYNERDELTSLVLRRFHCRSQNEILFTVHDLFKLGWMAEVNVPSEIQQQELENPAWKERVVGKKRNLQEAFTLTAVVEKDSNCSAFYCHESGLRKHLETSGHFYGKSTSIHTKRARNNWIPPTSRNSPAIANDIMIAAVQNFDMHHRCYAEAELPVCDDHSLLLRLNQLDKQLFKLGFGLERSHSNERRSLKQLKFLHWWISLGETNVGGKISPERAEQWMRIVGTSKGEALFPNDSYMRANPNGARTFKFYELLDEYKLKSYCSKGSIYIRGLIEKAERSSTGNTTVMNE